MKSVSVVVRFVSGARPESFQEESHLLRALALLAALAVIVGATGLGRVLGITARDTSSNTEENVAHGTDVVAITG